MRGLTIFTTGRTIFGLNFKHEFSRALRPLSTRFYTTSQQPNSRRFNIGVIGAGRIAGVHLRNMLSNSRLQLNWILEEQPKSIAEMKRQFPLTSSVPFLPYSKREELMADRNLDGVCVFSPISTHTEYICQALSHEKAVFTEKPAGQCQSDIKTCYETAEKFNKPLLTGYNRRFDAAYNEVRDAVVSGQLGKIQIMTTVTRDHPKPSYDFLLSKDNPEFNLWSDVVVHDIDMLTWLLGAQRPESICVNASINDPVLVDNGVPDTLVAVLRYPSGTLVTMDASREATYGYDIRLEVFGTEGRAAVENPRVSSSSLDGRDGGNLPRLHHSFPQRFQETFVKELDHFVDCMAGTASPLVTKEESVLVAEIVEKGTLSYNLGQVVQF